MLTRRLNGLVNMMGWLGRGGIDNRAGITAVLKFYAL
jgi:hypothetical protein